MLDEQQNDRQTNRLTDRRSDYYTILRMHAED